MWEFGVLRRKTNKDGHFLRRRILSRMVFDLSFSLEAKEKNQRYKWCAFLSLAGNGYNTTKNKWSVR